MVQNELEGRGHESKAGFIGTIHFFPPQRIKKPSTECGQDPHTHRHLSGRSKTQDKENCKNEYVIYPLFTPTQHFGLPFQFQALLLIHCPQRPHMLFFSQWPKFFPFHWRISFLYFLSFNSLCLPKFLNDEKWFLQEFLCHRRGEMEKPYVMVRVCLSSQT